MSNENVRERKKKSRFTLVLVPESDQPRTFSFTKWKFFAALSATFFGIVLLVALTLLYTPARSLLPVSNSEIEMLYGKQISAIQDQVVNLYQEMSRLRKYNLQLRKALGENVSPEETTGVKAPDIEALKNVQDDVFDESDVVEGKASTAYDQQPVAGLEMNAPGNFIPLPVSNRKVNEVMFPFSLPVDGYVSRSFDTGSYHYGIDFVSKPSSAILSAADGKILFSGWTYEDGWMIIIAHDFGYVTVYKHNEALLKKTGASVRRGEVIALLGNTGKTSSGPHLHFEIWKDGIPYDPANYLLMTQ